MRPSLHYENSLASESFDLPYYPVDLDFVGIDTVSGQDIYVKNDGAFVLYRNRYLPFTEADKRRLEGARVKRVYIYCRSERDVLQFYEHNLGTILESPKVDLKKKATVLHDCAIGIAQEVFDRPGNAETIHRSKQVVNHTINLIGKNSKAFLEMLSLSSHDYYTYSHCVNVMTFSLALLHQLGIKDQRVLKEIGIGALLHDVGKSKVPLEVLNKPGGLDDDEWNVMKQHPVYGLDLISDNRIPDRARQIIVEHHEKLDGSGYPYGRLGEQVQMASQVVSLCDAYDAMTTNRCYQEALKPFDAFKIIVKDMKPHFDWSLIETFIRLLNLRR